MYFFSPVLIVVRVASELSCAPRSWDWWSWQPHLQLPSFLLPSPAAMSDWSSITSTTVVDRALLDRLNGALVSSSYLESATSYAATAVDFTVFEIVAPAIAALAQADATALPSLLRWSRAVRASRPAGAAAVSLPAAVPSRIAELDLIAAAVADSKLRSAAAAAPAGKAAAAAPAKAAPAAAAAAAPVAAKAAAAAPAAAAAAAGGEKKEKKEKAPKAAKPAAAAADTVPQVYRVDFRVGKILSVAPHPTESRLFVEQIDVGESSGGVRTVVSGLAEHFTAAELVDRLVVVMVNLKAGDLKGVVSAGRIMVATGADGKKELATPPAGAVVGEAITFASVPKDKAPDAELAPKRLHEILKGLHTNAAKVVQYADADFQTSAGPVTVPTVADGTVA